MDKDERLVVRVKLLHPDGRMPRYAHIGAGGDLGADLFSIENVELAVGTTISIRTGIAIELPEGFGAIIQDRSGLASRGVTTLGGVVDPGYRGELKVIATNLSAAAIVLSKGERIGQLRLVRLFQGSFEATDELSASERDEAGFGSTGR